MNLLTVERNFSCLRRRNVYKNEMFIENFSLDINSSASPVKRYCQYYCCNLIAPSLIHFTFHIQSLPLALLDAHKKITRKYTKRKNFTLNLLSRYANFIATANVYADWAEKKICQMLNVLVWAKKYAFLVGRKSSLEKTYRWW